jgi:hypothetical protein
LPTPRDRLSLEHVISLPRNKSRTIFGSPVNDSKEDEKQTCLDEIIGGGEKKLDATATKGNNEKEHEPNLDHVIDNIQVELIVFVETVVSITKPATIATKSFQIIEHVQIKNP